MQKNLALAPLFGGVNISTSMAGKSANKDFTFKKSHLPGGGN